MYRTQSYREPPKRPKWALLVCVQGFLSDMARDSDSSVARSTDVGREKVGLGWKERETLVCISSIKIVPEVILPGDFKVTPSRERWRWVG